MLFHFAADSAYVPGGRDKRGRDQSVDIHLLKHATPELLDVLLPMMSPQDYYISDRGVGIGVESLRLLRTQFEEFQTTERAHEKLPGDPPQSADPSKADATPASSKPAPTHITARRPRKPPLPKRNPWRWQVCNADQAQALIREARPGDAERIRILRQLAEHSHRRLPRVTPARLLALGQLECDFPNFKPVVEEVRLHLQFQLAARMPLELPHLLLAGPPGIGKTEFTRRLAAALGLHFKMRSLAEMTVSFAITGSHKGWSNTTPGFIAQSVAETPASMIPMVLFDELDKVHERGSYPPEAALLGLLERRTAEHFRDDCLDLEINVRPMVFMLTCNVLDRVQPAVRSRLKVLRIEAPSREQMPGVVRSVDRSLRIDHPAIAKLFQPLSDEVITRLGAVNPRELSRLLLKAYGIAAGVNGRAQKKRLIGVGHVDAAVENTEDRRERVFGFVPVVMR